MKSLWKNWNILSFPKKEGGNKGLKYLSFEQIEKAMTTCLVLP